MEVGVDISPETVGVAMEFPVGDGTGLSSPPTLPPRLRRRLTETKASPSSVEEIEAKLRDADLRRQKFYEHLSSKARPKPRSPPQSAYEENLGQRLQAKLLAAEQKRSSILAKAQLRLAKLDQLRQAAKTGVEVRVKKECAELGTKVELRVRQAETNRMRILKAYKQRRATLRERSSQSLIRRIARESKYKERVGTAISQKRAAAEKKRLGLLEADMEKAHARLLQVRKVAKIVSQQREIERRRLRESLEDKLQRAKRQRAEYLMQRAKLHNSVGANWNKKMQKQADDLSRKLARCWRKFLKRKTTFELAKNYSVLNINEDHVKSMPFDQFALLIGTPSTLQTTKALLDRLEICYKALVSTACGTNFNGQNDIDHLLKRVASPKRRTTPRTPVRTRQAKKPGPARSASKTPVNLSRYQVRVVLCAYMILGHPDAVFSGQGERESALAESAKKFVHEFELLINIILQKSGEDSSHRPVFRSQLAAFDSAWCVFLNSFVVWKVKDAESLEEDLVRAACQMEISMMQKCKMTPEGDNDADLTHDMKAIQKQVTEDQKLLREKVMHLSGDAGIERMKNALSDTRITYFNAMENGSPVGSQIPHIAPSSSLLATPTADSDKRTKKEPNRVVRALFKDDNGDSKSLVKDVRPSATSRSSPESRSNHSGEMVNMENELIVNEFVHGQHYYSSVNKFNDAVEDQTLVKVRETMEKAFWDGITESIQEDNYDRVVELMKEVRDELCEMAPQSWKQEIIETIDVVILSQLLNSGSLDMEYLGKIMEFSLISLQKLSAPANESSLKEAHQKVLSELAEICQSDDSNHSHAIALVKGLRFVLQQIQELKQEISNARIKIMEPLLKGPAGLEYLGKAFAKRFGSPSEATARLPLTLRWLSSVGPTFDQEWNDHKRVLSGLQDCSPSEKRALPSTTLRTGGSSFSSGLQTSTVATATETADNNQFPECNGEKRDLLVRLGLLKLVNDVYGVTQQDLPETLKLNFLRLRMVQAQLQKIIVTATSILVLRQTLMMEQMISNPNDMETTIQKCSTELLQILDNVETAGLDEIVEVMSKTAERFDKTNDPTKTESRRLVMARMLRKSVQAEDSVFVKVSRAVYMATRGVVLGGSGTCGRQVAEMALRQVGAVVLTERVVEAGSVLGVMAGVTGSVHGPWYDELVKNV